MKIVLKSLSVEGLSAEGTDIIGSQTWKGGYAEVYARSAQAVGERTVFTYVVIEGDFDSDEAEQIATDILSASV